MKHTADYDAPWQDPAETVEWERFACYCDGGRRHYYVREPVGKCPPTRVTPPEVTEP